MVELEPVPVGVGYLEAWRCRCTTLADACRDLARRTADGQVAAELEVVAHALDRLARSMGDVGGLLPEELVPPRCR